MVLLSPIKVLLKWLEVGWDLCSYTFFRTQCPGGSENNQSPEYFVNGRTWDTALMSQIHKELNNLKRFETIKKYDIIGGMLKCTSYIMNAKK